MPDRQMEETPTTLLARLDERTGTILIKVNDLQSQLTGDYVTKQEFLPVRNVVYGLVGLILMSVVGALLLLVVKGNTP